MWAIEIIQKSRCTSDEHFTQAINLLGKILEDPNALGGRVETSTEYGVQTLLIRCYFRKKPEDTPNTPLPTGCRMIWIPETIKSTLGITV